MPVFRLSHRLRSFSFRRCSQRLTGVLRVLAGLALFLAHDRQPLVGAKKKPVYKRIASLAYTGSIWHGFFFRSGPLCQLSGVHRIKGGRSDAQLRDPG